MLDHLSSIFEPEINWDAIAALAGLGSAFLVLVSFLFLAGQIREARRATLGQSFLGIVGMVQTQEVRDARGRVFRLKGKALGDLGADDVADIELVCASYDVFGILCRNKLLPARIVVDSWGDSIMRAWEVCEPHVAKVRASRGAPEFWNDFEWLDKKAKSHRWLRNIFHRNSRDARSDAVEANQ